VEHKEMKQFVKIGKVVDGTNKQFDWREKTKKSKKMETNLNMEENL